jgi:uncharacterized protein YjbJ (UPF0337 family)
MKEFPLNTDLLEGNWQQIRNRAKAWWADLTDDDLDQASGRLELLIKLLQEKYGYSRKAATVEIMTRVIEFEWNL